MGDPLRIKQILSNLVSNAVKFTDHGYVLVRTSIEQESEKDYFLCISVTDTGIGISSEDQTKLFNAFNQADTSITRRYGGTGLGLVICKKLVEAMEGRIMLQSELNKGSTFSIYIKLEKLSAYEVEKNQSHRFNNIKALCFDDNSLQLEALCNGLGYWGIESVPVTSFNQLEKAFVKHQDCTIAFVNVNEGCEKQVAQILSKQSMPSVLISKWLIHNPQSLGAKAFLFKPISIQKLHEVIEQLSSQTTAPVAMDQELDNLRKQLRLIHPEILIAEDNPVNRMLLNSLLSELSNIETVEDGKETVKACNSKRYNLLLLDLQMPQLNGLEAAQLIRHQSLNKSTPIVLISASGNDINQEKMKKAGINLCLQKPIDEKQLLSHLLRLLNKARNQAIDWPLCVQKVSGNQALAEEFLKRFVAELHKSRSEFLELYSKKNIQDLQNAAHKLYGACCFCGVPRLQTQVSKLEKQAKEAKKIDDLKATFAELIRNIDEVIDEYDSLYAT